jgi:hypothetical protein
MYGSRASYITVYPFIIPSTSSILARRQFCAYRIVRERLLLYPFSRSSSVRDCTFSITSDIIGTIRIHFVLSHQIHITGTLKQRACPPPRPLSLVISIHFIKSNHFKHVPFDAIIVQFKWGKKEVLQVLICTVKGESNPQPQKTLQLIYLINP